MAKIPHLAGFLLGLRNLKKSMGAILTPKKNKKL